MGRHKYTKKELIALLQEWARVHGETPSQSQWDADVNMPSSNPCRARFGSWGKALEAAGLPIKPPTISALCKERMIKAHQGKTSFHWKGGRHVDKAGYMQVWKPDHPNAKGGHNKSYVAEHRFIMSEHLGRPLFRHENVHHKNGKRDDNRFENLELWTTMQPAGKRPADLVRFAREILEIYADIEI